MDIFPFITLDTDHQLLSELNLLFYVLDSDLNGHYVNWTETGPSGEGDCVTISSLTKLMDTKECDARLPFICSWNGEKSFLLVKEKKSWEEALEHCRSLNDIGLRFDLVSVESEDDYANMMNKVMEANTDEVSSVGKEMWLPRGATMM